jgi:hypothetical protein
MPQLDGLAKRQPVIARLDRQAAFQRPSGHADMILAMQINNVG